MGPTVSTPELFAEALFTDTSSWTVIDRGPFEALVPVTHVLNNMLSSFDPRSPGKLQLEVCVFSDDRDATVHVKSTVGARSQGVASKVFEGLMLEWWRLRNR